MIATVQNTMLPLTGNLVGRVHATVAKNATRHVQLDVRTEIDALKSSSFEFVTGGFRAMLVAQILEIALAGLVAHGAIEWMVKQ